MAPLRRLIPARGRRALAALALALAALAAVPTLGAAGAALGLWGPAAQAQAQPGVPEGREGQPVNTAPENAAPAAGAASAAAPSGPDGQPARGGQRRGFLFWVVFWGGAVVVMALVGRVVFREHLHERFTLKILRDRIGKVHPEFDPVNLTKWVHRAAPHLWQGLRLRDMAGLEAFATPEFLAHSAAQFQARRSQGRHHEARLAAILKVHTLGMYPTGDTPPPTGLELVLRVESRGVDCERDPSGKVVQGRPEECQLQHFWTLRHDGRRWRLHGVERAEADRGDLATRPAVPPLLDWRWPEGTEGTEAPGAPQAPGATEATRDPA